MQQTCLPARWRAGIHYPALFFSMVCVTIGLIIVAIQEVAGNTGTWGPGIWIGNPVRGGVTAGAFPGG